MTPELLAYLLDNDYIQEEDFPALLDDGIISEELLQEIPAIGKYNWQGFLRTRKHQRLQSILRKRTLAREDTTSGMVGGFTAGPLAFTKAQKKRMKVFRNRSGERYGMKEREDTLGERSPGTYAGFLLKKRFGGNLRKLADYHKHLRRQNVLGAIFR